MGLKKDQEKEYAKILFVQQNLTQKEIAERVAVSEKTIGKWVADGAWDKLKRSLLVTKKQQISMLYDQLEWLNEQIANRSILYDAPNPLPKDKKESDYPIIQGNVATSKEADTIMKLTASINKMETETSIGHIVEVAQEFIDFARDVDFKLSKEITTIFDMFINHKTSSNG